MQIDIGLFLIYFAIAAVCIPLVRIMGPVSITSYGLEETYDSDSGFPNVLYRVISPILCCGILTLIVSTARKAAIDFSATYGWAPVLLYWMILIAIKIKNHTMSGKLKPVILELVLSVLISYLFNEFVIAELLKGNVGILDSSNYAIQMELALFYAVIQLIVSLFTRINYQTTYSSARLSRGVSNEKLGLQYYSIVNTSEKKLFSYVRKYGELLPARYTYDPLLRDIFFSIMAIEDSNRPPAVRLLERVAHHLGLSKTTGIMQQDGGKPLTDEESVRLAASYIERMWDSYLRTFAKSMQSRADGIAISFGRTWYRYDYRILGEALESSFALLYGDYCGTRLLDANFVFREVKGFEERNHYGLLPDYIVACGLLFGPESNWLSEGEAFWENSYSICLKSDSEESLDRRIALYKEGAGLEDVNSLCEEIRNGGGRVFKVQFANMGFAKVFCADVEKEILDELGSGWKRV